MIRVAFIFLILIISVLIGMQLHRDPGYVLIAINHWTIESTLSVAIVVLIIVFTLIHGLLSVIHKLASIPLYWRTWRAKRRSRISRDKTQKGLIEFSEGHWLRAKNDLIKALPNTETPLFNYLTAARAAQELGDNMLRDHYLREAQQSMPEATIAVELTQAQLQLANQQWEQALATLRHLQDLAPKHPYVLKLLMHLYEEVKDWPQLIALLPTLKRHKIITDDVFNNMEQQAYVQMLINLIKQNSLELITIFMDNLPKHLKYNATIITEYSRYLLINHDDVKAEMILRRSLRKQFNPQLIALYGKLQNNTASLNFAESLLKYNTHSANLFLCLGRICISSNLWGKARAYIEKSIEYNPTPTAYAELGMLLEKNDDTQGAFNAYKQGLYLDINHLPDYTPDP